MVSSRAETESRVSKIFT